MPLSEGLVPRTLVDNVHVVWAVILTKRFWAHGAAEQQAPHPSALSAADVAAVERAAPQVWQLSSVLETKTPCVKGGGTMITAY